MGAGRVLHFGSAQGGRLALINRETGPASATGVWVSTAPGCARASIWAPVRPRTPRRSGRPLHLTSSKSNGLAPFCCMAHGGGDEQDGSPAALPGLLCSELASETVHAPAVSSSVEDTAGQDVAGRIADGPRVGIGLFEQLLQQRAQAPGITLEPLAVTGRLIEIDQQIEVISLVGRHPSFCRRSCLRRVEGQASTGSSLGCSALWRVWCSTAQLPDGNSGGVMVAGKSRTMKGSAAVWSSVVMASGSGSWPMSCAQGSVVKAVSPKRMRWGVRRPAASCVQSGKARSQAAFMW